mgnify:CR=1 FL=1
MLKLFPGPTKVVFSSKVIWLIKYAHYLMHVEIWTFHTSGKSCYMNKYNLTLEVATIQSCVLMRISI